MRDIARKNKLETAEIPESMEICFVADNNYKRFLKDYSPEKTAQIGTGEILDESGEVIGEHSGYTDYTIGQRKGLGLSNPQPWYVSNINPATNQITIGKKDSLSESICYVSEINWLVKNISFPCEVHTQIRYNSSVIKAELSQANNQILVQFSEPQTAVTPGQSIVFYEDDIVLGGGIIEKNVE